MPVASMAADEGLEARPADTSAPVLSRRTPPSIPHSLARAPGGTNGPLPRRLDEADRSVVAEQLRPDFSAERKGPDRSRQ